MSLLQAVVPDGVAAARADAAAGAVPLPPDEAACVRNAAPKRRQEFAAGRQAAREALRRLGHAGAVTLPADARRRPVWPLGIVGSIAHTAGCCAAIVAYRERYAGLGLDVEPNAPLEPTLLPRIGAPGEFDAARAAVGSTIAACRLVFSAKEAVYKAFNPLWDVFLDFHEVALEWGTDPTPGTGTFRAAIEEREHGIRATCHGRYGASAGFIYTVTWPVITPP
jgi:4'-phosphopantetheinyl transferase EntD